MSANILHTLQDTNLRSKNEKILIVFMIIILLPLFVSAIEDYNNSKVRPEIYNNVKKYNELLSTAVENLKNDGTEDKELTNSIGEFYDKFISNKITKKEDTILCELIHEQLCYKTAAEYKRKGAINDYSEYLNYCKNTSLRLKNNLKNR